VLAATHEIVAKAAAQRARKLDRNMIRMTIALTRLETLSAREFKDYWRSEHGDLVRELAETLGIKRYVQAHAIAPDQLKNGQYYTPPYDGLAQVWYESYGDYLNRITSPSGKEAAKRLRQDEQRFAQIELSRTWWSEEHKIL
jgi:uncharacterized protein (TIGR02118 family)